MTVSPLKSHTPVLILEAKSYLKQQQEPLQYDHLAPDPTVSSSNRAGHVVPETLDDTVQLAGDSEDDTVMEAVSRIAAEVRAENSLVLPPYLKFRRGIGNRPIFQGGQQAKRSR